MASKDQPAASTSDSRTNYRTKSRRSPSLENDRPGSSSRQPPPKRARKAINCEPCRNSKLKCDRNRPCSSCVLRGTTALCYQGQEGDSVRSEETRRQVDPILEITRIRHSLSLLETHLKDAGTPGIRPTLSQSVSTSSVASATNGFASSSKIALDSLVRDSGDTSRGASSSIVSTPGVLGKRGKGGLYTGPTSTVSNLLSTSDPESSGEEDKLTSPVQETDCAFSPDSVGSVGSASSRSVYDEDLIAQLPPIEIVDALITYYFDYCNWIYRHIHEPSLLAGWARFKTGNAGDRVVLASVCIILALALRYLSSDHELLTRLPGSPDELSRLYHKLMRTALKRHRETTESLTRTYTLSLIELLLGEAHLTAFQKDDTEEVWSLGGELVSIGTAMGLHRDPGKSRFDKAMAERRRWAWWHILLFERWQAFMFGRPLRIASHHFDTQLPSYSDPAIDKTGRLYVPNVVLFRLAFILGYIMDDAVSFRAVPYSAILEQDSLLTRWYDALPPELVLDEFALARGLVSTDTSRRCFAVQSVVHRCSYYHIRFTLHRPYAKVPASLDIAVSAACDLIALFGQVYNVAPVAGHFNWCPFHVFSAAMFFSFQLITNPDQPGKGLFREQVRKAITVLEKSRWLPISDKALTILQALEPLYSDELVHTTLEQRAERKAQVLKVVKGLAFPYQDSPYSRDVDSPGYRPFTPNAPRNGVASLNVTPPPPMQQQAQQQPMQMEQVDVSLKSARWGPAQPDIHYGNGHSPTVPMSAQHRPRPQPQHPIQGPPPDAPMQSMPDDSPNHAPASRRIDGQLPVSSYRLNTGHGATTMQSYAIQQMNMMSQPLPHHARNFGDAQNVTYMHPADESSMWGASVGFGLGEWAQFLDVLHRPEGGPPIEGPHPPPQ